MAENCDAIVEEIASKTLSKIEASPLFSSDSSKRTGLKVVAVFEESGTFVVPDDGNYIVVVCGGGDSGSASNPVKMGGNGAIEKTKNLFLKKGSVVPIVVGKGGVGRLRVTTSERGGTSSFGNYVSSIGGNNSLDKMVKNIEIFTLLGLVDKEYPAPSYPTSGGSGFGGEGSPLNGIGWGVGGGSSFFSSTPGSGHSGVVIVIGGDL